MDKFSEIETFLQTMLPRELQSQAHHITNLISSIINGSMSMDEARNTILQDESLSRAVIDLQNSNLGDLTIGNVAGNNLIHNLYLNYSHSAESNNSSRVRQEIRFHEDFDRIPDFWYTGIVRQDISDFEREIVNGRYIWRVKTTAYERDRTLPNFPLVAEFEMEATMRCMLSKGQAAYGLTFGRSNAGFYVLALDTSGEVQANYYDRRTMTWTLLGIPYTKSFTEFQTLKVISRDQNLTFRVDDALIASFNPQHPTVGKMGIYVETSDEETEVTIEIIAFSLSYTD